MTDSDVSLIMSDLGTVSRDIYGWTWGPFRVERGGGIAGNSHAFWIRFPGNPDAASLGPFHTPLELKSAIRKLLLAAIYAGQCLAALKSIIEV